MDKQKLLGTPRLTERDVEIAGIGTVRIRGLTRGEVQRLHEGQPADPDPAVIERKLIAIGMVDPHLTEDEVKRWQEVSPFAEIQPVVEAISAASGMAADSAKETYKSVRGKRGS